MRPSRRKGITWSACALLVGLLPACGWAGEIVRPLVFLPGMGGSNLIDPATGREYFGSLQLAVDNLHKIALPADPKRRRLKATRVLERYQSLSNERFDQFNILQERLEGLGYELGETLFFFPYDWRVSNFETAKSLYRFIAEHGLEGRSIDIMAHSMGALAATIYIQTNPRDQRVRNLVAMGTPHYGSTMALQALMEGFPALGVANWLVVGAGSYKTVFRVFGSFESVYELLPVYPGCCFVSGPAGKVAINVLRRQSWVEHGLLDVFLDRDEAKAFLNQAHVVRAFRRARHLNALLGERLPGSVRKIVVANNSFPTPAAVEVDANGAGAHLWLSVEDAGDDTVTTGSALGPRHDKVVLYSNASHDLIFDDDRLWAKLARLLTEPE